MLPVRAYREKEVRRDASPTYLADRENAQVAMTSRLSRSFGRSLIAADGRNISCTSCRFHRGKARCGRFSTPWGVPPFFLLPALRIELERRIGCGSAPPRPPWPPRARILSIPQFGHPRGSAALERTTWSLASSREQFRKANTEQGASKFGTTARTSWKNGRMIELRSCSRLAPNRRLSYDPFQTHWAGGLAPNEAAVAGLIPPALS